MGCSPWGRRRAGHDLATNTATLNTLNTGSGTQEAVPINSSKGGSVARLRE